MFDFNLFSYDLYTRDISISFYPYRKVLPKDVIITINTRYCSQYQAGEVNSLLKELCEKANTTMDNHIGFTITYNDTGKSISLYYSDFSLYICLDVVKAPN